MVTATATYVPAQVLVDSSILEPARIQVPSWTQQVSKRSPLTPGSPVKVACLGTLAAVVSIEERSGEGLGPPFVFPPGLAAAQGSPSSGAVRKSSREDCISEAETYSGSDRGAPSPLPSVESESAGSGSECAGQSLRVPKHSTPSVGSVLHEAGDCRPCAWYWKPSGCENMSACIFCHMCPEGEVKNRKKSKLVALRQARRVEKLDGGIDVDGDSDQHQYISL